MPSRLRAASVSVLVLLWPLAAQAQDAGDVAKGRIYAERTCAECHGIERGDSFSPNPDAPPFAVVANTGGMTPLALTVWFRTPHPTMPNLLIVGAEKDNVIAYILSLKEGG